MTGVVADLFSFLLALALLAPLAAQAEGFVPPVDEQAHLSPRWRVALLPNQKKPATRFSGVKVDGRAAVLIDADSSYGNLVLDLPGQPVPRRIHWSWRIEQPNPAADLHEKAGDDTAARVCLSFDLPLDRVPFVERQVLRVARSAAGESLPAATLCWVWGVREAPGSVIDSPFSRRLRYLVLRNQADGVGQWHEEHRDVMADFRRVFGDESPEPPPLVAVAVAGDADNTHLHTRAHVASLSLEP